MTDDRDTFAEEYQAALLDYTRSRDEAGRSHAYELGHRAVQARLGLLDLVAMHQAAVEDVVSDPHERRRAHAALEFLTESLATFDMAQRGYLEVQERAALAHDIALTLQRSLLPDDLPVPPGLDVAVRYLPAGPLTEVGGDWYDVVALDDDRVGLVVGDVMGHGIHQAATMGQLRFGLRAYLLSEHALAEAVQRTGLLLQSLGRMQTATLVIGVVDVPGAKLTVANAGHPPPILIDPAGAPSFLTGGHGRLLGLSEDTDRPVRGPDAVVPGSCVLMYTDGLLERSERAREDGFARLLESVAGFDGGPAELCDSVTEAFVADHPADDVCLLAAKVAPAAG